MREMHPKGGGSSCLKVLREPNVELLIDDESTLREQQRRGEEAQMRHAQRLTAVTEKMTKESLRLSYHHLQVSLNYLQQLSHQSCHLHPTFLLGQSPTSNQCPCCRLHQNYQSVSVTRKRMIQAAKNLRKLHVALGYQSPYVGVLEKGYLSAEGKISD